MLPEMDVEFNSAYLSSQEAPQHYSGSEEDYANPEDEDCNSGMEEAGGGLEEILWTPELLMQARTYRSKKSRKRRNGAGSS